MFRRVLTSLTVVVSFSAILAVNPPPSQAIPTAGDYEFISASGLSGTFTSDGSILTQWDITEPSGYQWQDTLLTQEVIVNDQGAFVTADPLNLFQILSLSWDPNPQSTGVSYFAPGSDTEGTATFKSVPEPSTALLVLAGLGFLAGYSWRQQRQAEVQVGSPA